jgi:hypothetical protein
MFWLQIAASNDSVTALFELGTMYFEVRDNSTYSILI